MSHIANSRFQVTSLDLYQAGTYNPQYRRPIVVDVSVSDCMAFDEATKGGTQFTPGHLSGLVNNIVNLSANVERNMLTTDGSVPIINDWRNERCRFVLEIVEEMSPTSRAKHYYIGYTDSVGFTQQGTREANIDKHLQFYVNSVVSVVETDVMRGGGIVTISRVSRSDSYLTGHWMQNSLAYHNDYSCRPQEVIDHMTCASVINKANINAPINNAGSTFGVSRIKPSSSLNSRPTQYISRILESLNKASAEQEGGYLDSSLVLDTASGYGSESLLAQEPIFRLIDTDAVINHGFFTFSMLERGVPHIDHVTHVHKYDGSGMFGHSVAGQTAYRHDSTIENQIMSIVENALPSIMAECLFRSLNIHVSNNNVTVEPHCVLVPLPVLPGEVMARPSFTMLAAHSDVAFWWDRFQTKFLSEVFLGVTSNNVNIVDMHIEISITGDINMTCSVNGGSRVDFRNPCFCNNVISSLVSNNPMQVDKIANDVFSLTNHASNALESRTQDALMHSPFGIAPSPQDSPMHKYTQGAAQVPSLFVPTKSNSPRWD